MEVWKFAYISQIVEPDALELEEIIDVSLRKNGADGIGGVLFYDDRSYLQVLEGARDALAHCVLRISADPRHHWMTTLYSTPSMTRLFSSWGLGSAQLPGRRRTLSGFAEDLMQMSLPDRLSSVEKLCLDVSP